MANHLELLNELQQLDKAPSLERLRAAQKRRAAQLKRWAAYEKDMQSRRRKADRRQRHHGNHAATVTGREGGRSKHVSFTASVALLEASARNDPEEVRYLLKNNVSPDLCNEDGLTALHQCCIDNYEEMVRVLLGRGAGVNAQDNELWTPLHAAATCGHAGLVKTLILHGADLLAVNSDGNMPYDLCEDDPTLDLIETAMANRGITQEMINETRASAERCMLGEIQRLVAEGAELNQQDSQGATLLHISAANGYVQAAELLLEGGASMDLRDGDGWQPLHAAACWGQMHVAELLVSHGASLNSRTYLEETPIDLCEDEEFRNLLLDLKHKHDVIMKSQLKHKTSLCRRTSSAGSRRKVVRRASLSDRHNLCRKEYETEAIVWRGGREEENREQKNQENQENSHKNQENQENSHKNQETSQKNQEKNQENQENSHKNQEKNQENQDNSLKNQESSQMGKTAERPRLQKILKDGVKQNGLVSTVVSTSVSTPPRPPPPPSADAPSPDTRGVAAPPPPPPEEAWPRERAQTLSELKKQRSAAKLLSQPLLNGLLGNGGSSVSDGDGDAECGSVDSRMPLVSSNGSAVYYTPASGDPPLLRLKQPAEEEEPKDRGCCCVS